MIGLSDISKDYQFLSGGNREVNMLNVEDLVSMALPVLNVVPKGIKVKPGKPFRRFNFSLDTCSFTQSTSKTIHGKETTIKVSFTHRYPTPEIIYELEKMKRMKFIVVPKDNEGQYRIMGSKDAPASFDYTFTTGPNFTNVKTCVCTFTAKQKTSAYFYGGTLNQVVFNSGFTFGFLRTE